MKLLKTAALLMAAAGAGVALSTSNNNNNNNNDKSNQIISDKSISNINNIKNISLLINNINQNSNSNNNKTNNDENIYNTKHKNNIKQSIQNHRNNVKNGLENQLQQTTTATISRVIQKPSTFEEKNYRLMKAENIKNSANYTPVVIKNTDKDAMTDENVSIAVENSDNILFYNQSNYDHNDYPPCHPDNPHFNCSRQEFLQYRLGPQRLPFYKILLVTIVFGAIFLTSILGNVLVCIVIVRHSSMHTATNYYLFSLAVSDLLYLIFGLPAEVFLYYHQYPYLFGLHFCKIRAFISEASTYVSVLTIVAFSMERFLAICHPLHLYAMSGFKRAVRLIAALWIISFLSAIPFAFMTGIQYLTYPLDNSIMLESAFCSTIWIPQSVPIFELSFCVFFGIPMILIIIVYGRMGAQIRSTTLQQLGVQQCTLHRESRHQQSRKAVIRMLAAVVITFFICWLPFHLQRLYFLYAQDDENYAEINEWIYNIAGFAYYISCSINPILYNVMSHRYRVAFKDILCGKRSQSYYKNGFAREHSSFRETMASSLGGNSTYDRVHSVRVRSSRHLNPKDRDSIKSNNTVWRKRSESHTHHESKEDHLQKGTHMLVVMENAMNGRTKCYTESEIQESLINQNNETCI